MENVGRGTLRAHCYVRTNVRTSAREGPSGAQRMLMIPHGGLRGAGARSHRLEPAAFRNAVTHPEKLVCCVDVGGCGRICVGFGERGGLPLRTPRGLPLRTVRGLPVEACKGTSLEVSSKGKFSREVPSPYSSHGKFPYTSQGKSP